MSEKDLNPRSRNRIAARVALYYALFAALWIFASDRLLGLMVSDGARLAALSTYKGWAFVAITASLLFVCLRSRLIIAGVQEASPEQSSEPLNPRPMLIGFVLLVVAICLLALLSYRHQENKIRQEESEKLSAIADLKSHEIEAWLDSKRAEARLLMSSLFVMEKASDWLTSATEPTEGMLRARLQDMLEASGCQSLFLLDDQARLRLFVGETPRIDPVLRVLAKQALNRRDPVFADIQRDPEASEGGLHLDFLVPLLSSSKQAGQPIAMLVMRCDPHRYLYPLVQSWPVPSATSETLLVRPEGDAVLFLNELRHRPNTALSLRIPLQRREVPAVWAALKPDHSGIFEGLDYRGAPVLSVARPIRGTPWIMIAKVDRSEIFSDIRQQALLIALLTLLAITVAGAFAGFYWRQQKIYFQLRSRQQEIERAALIKHFDYLSKFANDIVLLLDQEQRIVEANDRAVQAYGWDRSQLLGMPAVMLRAPASRGDFQLDHEPLLREGRALFRTWHQRRDGSLFPAEISARDIEIDGRRYQQSIIRDISERHDYEQQLAETERFTRSILDALSMQICVIDPRGSIVATNRVWREFAEAYGVAPDSASENSNYLTACASVFGAHSEQAVRFDEGVQAVLQGTSQTFTLEYACHAQGGKRWLLGHVTPIPREEGRLAVIAQEDITDIKLATEKIARLSNMYAALSETNQLIVRTRDRAMLFKEVCRIAVEHGRFRHARIGLIDTPGHSLSIYAQAGDDDIHPESSTIPPDNSVPTDQRLTATAVAEGVPAGLRPDTQAMSIGLNAAQAEGFTAASFPIREEGKIIGAFTVWTDEFHTLDPALIHLLDEMSLDISFGLDTITREAHREEMVKSLSLSEARYRSIFSNMAVGWTLTDRAGRFAEFNDTWCRMIGYSGGELFQLSNMDITYPDDREATRRYSERLLAGEIDHSRLEKRYLRRDGQLLWGDVTLSPYRDAQGNIRGIIGIIVDNTERKRAEEALQRREQEFRLLVEHLPHIIARFDREGRHCYINPAITKATGLPPAAYLGKTHSELGMDEALVRQWGSALTRVFETGRDFHTEFYLPSTDGPRHYDSYLVPEFGDDNTVRTVLAVNQDTTDRNRYEAELLEAEAKFRGLVEQTIAGIFITDGHRFHYVNPHFAEIFGYTVEEILRLEVTELIADGDIQTVSECLRKHLSRDQHNLRSAFQARRKDGSEIPIGMHSSGAVYKGQPAIIGILQDISERKHSEDRIRQYIERLEQAMLGTVEAVSLMSELRDPYTAGHERRVGDLAAAIGQELGLPEDTVKGLRIIGSVHDIGKITIPAEILSKPSRLSALEFEMIKTHPRQGYEILKATEFPWPVAQAILQHHERLDGSGYPHGLSGEAICLEARIIAVADVVEAISSHRPYRPALGTDAAFREITEFSGLRYDTGVVEACLSLFRERGYAFPTPH